MNSIRVENAVQDHFAMVPNALWQLGISCTAKALYAYLLHFHRSAAPRAVKIEADLRIGRDARRKAMAQLKEHGLAWYELERGKGGKVVGKTLVLSALKTHRPPEKPTVGKTTLTEVESRPSGGRKSGDIIRQNNTNRGQGLKNPEFAKDPEVQAAVRTYLGSRTSEQEKAQIERWLADQGFAQPEARRAAAKRYYDENPKAERGFRPVSKLRPDGV